MEKKIIQKRKKIDGTIIQIDEENDGAQKKNDGDQKLLNHHQKNLIKILRNQLIENRHQQTSPTNQNQFQKLKKRIKKTLP
jgi:hypothetical protein